ncbi:MAG: DNA-directed RNA polymerase subunit alpha [Bacilli bacterium]|nr:DNA-directed RNA polymerase subunit alpha [Bacilli bacterium]
MRKVEFIKPSMEIDNEFSSDKNYCKLRVTPLERGYGQTIGNSMRRVLLSSLPGAAAVAIAIEGVDHEFTPVDGVIEDVTEIILNVKNIVFTIDSEDNAKGIYGADNVVYESIFEKVNNTATEMPVTAGDINLNFEQVLPAGENNHLPHVTVVNPEQLIATLAPNGKIRMTLRIRNGVGYVNADENKKFCKDGVNRIIGLLPIDSIFTPVTKCRYTVEKTRFEDNFDCDLLTLEVWTNGSIEPTNALSLAGRFLAQHFAIIEDLNEYIKEREFMLQKEEKVTNKKLDKKIEDLDLSVRSYNCLKRANINTVGELTQKTEEEMMKVRNLGRKSLKEVIQKLNEIGLELKPSEGRMIDFDEEDFEEQDVDDKVVIDEEE